MLQYGLTCVQTVTHIPTERADVPKVMRKNVQRAIELIQYVAEEPRYPTKVILFPEFFLTSVAEDRTYAGYDAISTEIPGEVTDLFVASAKKYGLYIVGNCFERAPDWPGRCFNTAWIMNPGGEIILKYRKLNDFQGGFPASTNPGDLYTQYIERYGPDALFPVVDTEIGRLGCMTCYDVNFPEVARGLALRGAEIILMPTGEPYGFNERMRMLRRARAFENTVYVATANHGEFIGPRPRFQQRGHSEVIDYWGRTMEVLDGPGEATVTGFVDIEALRRRRAQTDRYNLLVMLRASTYVRQYQNAPCWPADGWADRSIVSNADSRPMAERVLQQLYQAGIYVRPQAASTPSPEDESPDGSGS